MDQDEPAYFTQNSDNGLNEHQSTQFIDKNKTKTSANKKFHRLFPNLSNERVVNAFSCALLRNNGHLLLQGTLYLTKRYFAFHSNIFGYQTSLFKKWSDVCNVKKDKIALVFPTAISIFTKEKYFFASFLSRNQAFRSICKLWNQQIISTENKIIVRENSVYLDAINDENNLIQKCSLATTSNHSSSRSSSLVKISSSLSSSKSSLTSSNHLNETEQFLSQNFDSSFENDIPLSNINENLSTTTNDQSLKSIVINSIENIFYFIASFFFLNKLQLFFQYLCVNSSINNFDDYETQLYNRNEANLTETNYLNHFLIFLSILLIMFTLYIYVFLIYFHVTKIESQLSEIEKLFNT